jgi:hypothetical protein
MAAAVDLGALTQHVSLSNLLCVACGLIAWKFRGDISWLINSWLSPLRHLAGPENESIFLGNLLTLAKAQNTTIWEDWVEKYGKTLRYRGFFGVCHALLYL